MDCRETQTLLTAFHDGELPAPGRAGVEEHLRACSGCRALLADLARADAASGVPDPGPGYWDRFNARVSQRIEREAESTKVAVLHPERGWVRQQLRYLVPAAAAAALVMVVVRYGGLHPGPTVTAVPPTASDVGVPGRPSAGTGREATGSVAPAPGPKKTEAVGMERRLQEEPARVSHDRNAVAAHDGRDRLPDRSLREANEVVAQDRAEIPSVGAVAPPPPAPAYRAAPAVPPPVAEAEPRLASGERSDSGMKMEKERPSAAPEVASLGKARDKGAVAPLASAIPPSPCGQARELAAMGRFREAETAQRACLEKDLTAPAQEKGLIFLAELLDRQERFADADAVLANVHRQFPESRPLEHYLQQRPMVQKVPAGAPVLLR